MVLDNNTVSLEDTIGFRCRNGEAVRVGLQLDRCLRGELAITSVCDFVRPDELTEAKESVETRQKLSEKVISC